MHHKSTCTRFDCKLNHNINHTKSRRIALKEEIAILFVASQTVPNGLMHSVPTQTTIDIIYSKMNKDITHKMTSNQFKNTYFIIIIIIISNKYVDRESVFISYFHRSLLSLMISPRLLISESEENSSITTSRSVHVLDSVQHIHI